MSAPDYEANMIGYWPLDDAAGSTAEDRSGYGHDGVLVNMESGDWIDAVLSGGLQFDGVDERVYVNDTPDHDGILSWSCWVHPIEQNSHATYWHVLIGKPEDFKQGLFIGYAPELGNQNKFAHFARSDVGSRSAMEYFIEDYDQWYHLVGVFRDGYAWLYVNGETLPRAQWDWARTMINFNPTGLRGAFTTRWWNQQLDNNQNSADLATPLKIAGWGPAEPGRYSKVRLDDLRIFDIALDEYQVKRLYGGGLRKYWVGISSDNAVELYPINYRRSTKQARFDHRTQGGGLLQYNYGSQEKIAFECDFVPSSDVSLVNSWWDTNTDLIFFVQSDWITEVNSVRLVNETQPFQEWSKPDVDKYRGRIELEGY